MSNDTVQIYAKDLDKLVNAKNTYFIGVINAVNMMDVYKKALKERCTAEEYAEIEAAAFATRKEKI